MHSSSHPHLTELPADKFGAHLRRLIPLSELDVEEILHEQRLSQRRFGEVALSMGLCQPEHVWKAWANQLDSHTPRVRLSKVGVDSTTVKLITGTLARQLGALPLRKIDEEVLVAVSHLPDDTGRRLLEQATGYRVKFLLASESELEQWIDRYYPKC